MCVSRCLRCVGVSLVPLSVLCFMSNVLLLLPELNIKFLFQGHVTREARWASGLWASGVMVLLGARSFVRSSRTRGFWSFRAQSVCQLVVSAGCVVAAGCCCVISVTGLVQGPLCLYNTSAGPEWGVPLRPRQNSGSSYLYAPPLWSGVCLRPRSVVQWNLVLFGLMGGASGLQALICAANTLNCLTGLVLGPGRAGTPGNKVGSVSV